MMTMALLAALNCAPTVVINNTDNWTEEDSIHMVAAIKRCPELYPESPCLKVFRKKEPLLYRATCGAEKE